MPEDRAAFGIYPSSGRRHEKLNQSRDVNAPLQLLRGWAAGLLGMPGDVEGIFRETPAMPTSDFYREYLPGYDERPAARAMSGLAALTGGAGATRVAREGLGAVKRATDVDAIRRYISSSGAPGTPMVVWHGSPHKFEKFDASKIGTGEGAQAYGHGIYVAESPDVAKSYQNLGEAWTVDGVPVDGLTEHAAQIVKQYGIKGAKEYVQNMTGGGFGPPPSKEWIKNQLDAIENLAGKRIAFENTGSLYKVDLPDEKIARMLDWDKPLSQQAPEVRKAIDAASESPMLRHLSKSNFGGDVDTRGLLDRLSRAWRRDYGVGGEPEVVDVLRQSGIPGIRYLDQGSRGAGQGTSNFVVFPGEEEWLKILERNGVPIPPGYAGGGVVKALQAMLTRAPAKSKQEIEAIAERVAPQVTGEYVRIKPESAVTVAGKTKKQFQREKTLPVDIRSKTAAKTPEQVDLEKLKGEVMIGIPGDPTVTSKDLYSVGETVLERPSPQYGGPQYGLYHDKDHFWASGLGAARRVQNLVREASEQYGAPVVGKYIMMGPDSINYAQHFADANLQAIDLSKMSKRQIEGFNNLIRQGNLKSGPRPSFPGIEDKDAAYLHLAEDPELRKHFNALMQQSTIVERFNLPSGQDIRYAITEPSLRDLETGVTGYSLGRMRPEIPSTELKLSEHPTYSHDIPGEFLGGTKYPIPYELSFPDTLKAIRENPAQAPQEFGSLKMVGPRQIIDQQLIDEIKTYEERMKALTGKKRGGAVKAYAKGGLVSNYDAAKIAQMADELLASEA